MQIIYMGRDRIKGRVEELQNRFNLRGGARRPGGFQNLNLISLLETFALDL